MNTIELTPKNFIKYKKRKVRKRFILIGSDSIKHRRFLRKIIRPKLKKKFQVNVPGFWATLGFADGSLRNWTGNIHVSEYGNDTLKGVGKHLSKLIQHIYGLDDDARIIERFISFDDSRFEFPEGEFIKENIPRLRLTIMLGKNESALVFYQRKDPETREEFPQFIMPEATEGHNMDQRDRLTYYFTAIPNGEFQPVDKKKGVYTLKRDGRLRQFKVKVIIFSRKQYVDSHEFLNFMKRKTFCKGEKEAHCLLKFDQEKNDFSIVNGNEIDPSLKSLFLIHGTFASTAQSFSAVYKGNNDWLKKQCVQEGGKYEQVIAFDHPSVTDDARMNTAKLFEMLGDHFKFQQDVDVIATSQGGLFAQYLANYPFDETKIPIGNVALIASANGVDYFKAGAHIADFLTLMMHCFESSGNITAAFIVGLASQSASFFLNLPGSKMMTPGSLKLDEIMSQTPVNQNTCYLPIIDDFDKHSQVDSDFLSVVFRILSVLVYPVLGKYNDLVVRTKNQYQIHKEFCCIPGYDPEHFKDRTVSSIHGKALKLEAVQDMIASFLKSDVCQCE